MCLLFFLKIIKDGKDASVQLAYCCAIFVIHTNGCYFLLRKIKKRMTSILLQFPPPPRRSYMTVFEQDGQLKSIPESAPVACVSKLLYHSYQVMVLYLFYHSLRVTGRYLFYHSFQVNFIKKKNQHPYYKVEQ